MGQGIRQVGKTFQAAAEMVSKLRETNHQMLSHTIESTQKLYGNKVNNTNWQAGTSGFSLLAAGAIGIMGALSGSEAAQELAKMAAKTGEIGNTVLHGYDIGYDAGLQKETHALEAKKQLEEAANRLQSEFGQEVSQLIAQDAEEFKNSVR